jgi:lysophospholipid acyltransferase (LPLAT)-like uncharacterized protein
VRTLPDKTAKVPNIIPYVLFGQLVYDRESAKLKRQKKKEKGDRLWFRLVLFLVPRLVTGYFRFVDWTSRKIYLNEEIGDQVCDKRPFTCAVFHGTMLYPVYHCRKYPGVIMVSRSWDGELIDKCLKRWKFDTTRGSSSRGGKEALAVMIEMMNENRYCSGLAVDAPRGPSRKAKMGVIVLARDTETPIVPIVSWCTRQVQFNSWDRMILPLPFSTIVMAFGNPLEIPKGLGDDDYEGLRVRLEEDMLRVSQMAEDTVTELKAGRKSYA